MIKKSLFFLLLCFIAANSAVFSQNEASNWYFGYGSGLKFNLATGVANAVDDGSLSTNEGCATISDSAGNLLFYTDGTTVKNRNHAIMQGGNGLFGDASSTQSAIIVPKPKDPNIYYIFTVDNNLDERNFGFNYSTVDMRKDGGLGAVTSKNINLLPLCSEKISAVLKDCSEGSIWVIAFASKNGNRDGNNSFHAFEVSETGINHKAVVSPFPSLNIVDQRGYLKLSPDGTKLACANMSNGLYLFDFDAETGIVSNLQPLEIKNSSANKPYGVEFSPNSKLLYVHASNDYSGEGSYSPSAHRSILIQYNLTAPNITSSQVVIDDRQLYRGALQLGPNGKIYRALSATYTRGLPYLGIIHNPDKIGTACNYENNGVQLSPNTSSQGLPPFIQSLFNTQIDIINNGESAVNLNLCDGDRYTLKASKIPGATYSWTKDDIPLPETSHTLEVTKTGHYQLTINPNNGECDILGQAYVNFYDNPQAFNHTLLQCDEDGTADGVTQFNLKQAHAGLTGGVSGLTTKFYADDKRTLKIADSGNYTNTSNPQTIYVTVINEETGCDSFSELTLSVSRTDSKDTELIECDNDGVEDGLFTFDLTKADNAFVEGLPTPENLTISYYETYEEALLETNNLGARFKNKIPYAQTIFARIENANNCYGISEVKLTVNKLPNIETEQLVYYCLNSYPATISLEAGVINDSPSNYKYEWNTGETTYQIEIDQPGKYTVTVTNTNGCSKQKTITVAPSNVAAFKNIEVVDATQNNTITVLVSGEGLYEYQLLDKNKIVAPYQESNVFENIAPGIYTLTVRDIKNDCGAVQNLVSVIGFPKFFTPNKDGYNDYWQVMGLSQQFQPESIVYIYDRYGKLLKQLNPLGNGWDGTFNGQPLPATDYWFTVKLQDGRVYHGHFALIR